MKKQNIFIAFMLVCTLAIAQDSLTAIADPLDHASQQAQQIIDTAVIVADATGNEILPGVDNRVIGGAFSVIVLGLIALIRKKRKNKKSQQ